MNTYIKSIIDDPDATVAQLVVSNPAALTVFAKYNIDYCCGGHQSLDEACRKQGLDPAVIKDEILKTPDCETAAVMHPENWSSTFLADYIVQNHHHYVRKAIPEVQALLDKVCEAHGDDCQELLNIRENFFDLSDELTIHMQKEELVLFPAIKRLEERLNEGVLKSSIQTPINAMEHEHVVAGDLIKQIRELSNNYTPPDFACPTFRITYKKLQEFDADLMQHIHLENNILFERFKL